MLRRPPTKTDDHVKDVALAPTSAEMFHAFVVCHRAFFAFHHFFVTLSWNAVSTLPTPTASVAAPRMVTGAAGTTALFAGLESVTTGAVVSPVATARAVEYTSTRSLPASER